MRLRAAALLLVIPIAVGCAGPSAPPPPPAPPPAAPPVESSVAPSPAAPAPTPSAADGKNYASCTDGTCEVLIDGPVTVTLKGHPLELMPSPDGSVSFGVSDASHNVVSSSMSVGCTYRLTFAGGLTTYGCLTGNEATPRRGATVMKLESSSAEGAVVSFTSN